jgi:hypothetical protein
VQYGCPEQQGFLWAGRQTKTLLPPPIARAAGFSLPSRKEEGRTSLRCDLPERKSVVGYLLQKGQAVGRPDCIVCWLRARTVWCYNQYWFGVRRGKTFDATSCVAWAVVNT